MTRPKLKNDLWKIWLVAMPILSIVWAYGLHFAHWYSKHGLLSEKIFLNLPTQIFALGAILVGTKIHLKTNRERLPWFIIFMALFCFTYGSGELAINYKTLFGHKAPFPSFVDYIDLLFYPLMVTALLLFDRRRNPKRDQSFALDGVVVGTLTVIVVFLLAPSAPEGGSNIGLIYPAMDIMVLGAMARLVIGSKYFNLARAFLSLAIIVAAMADTVIGYLFLREASIPFGLGDQLYSAIAIFLGAAALHPDMIYIGRRRPNEEEQKKLPVRSIAIALIFVSPLLLLTGVLRIWVPWAYGLAIAEMMLFAQP